MYQSTKPFFNLTTVATIYNNTHYKLAVCTSYATKINSIFYGRIIFNETADYTAEVFLNSYSLNMADASDWSSIESSYNSLPNVLMGISSYAFTGIWNWLDTSPTDVDITANSIGILFIEKMQMEPLVYTCPVGYTYLYVTTMMCYDICPDGTFASVDRCIICPIGCLLCSAGVCSSCNAAGNFTLSTGLCECIGGYYLTGKTCTPCPASCLLCSSATVCSSCDTTNNFTLMGNMCGCDTTSNYILSGTSCKLCSQVMALCTSCSSSTVCTLCPVIPLLALSAANKCECALGYYLDLPNSQCLACTLQGCVNCSSLTTCLACDTDFVLSGGNCVCTGSLTLVSGVCSCPTGKYRVGTSCLACSLFCENCTNSSSTACVSCSSPKVLQSGSCLCPQGTYRSGVSPFACLPCHYSCLNCTSGTSTGCTVCDAAANRTLLASACSCNLGYYDSSQAACSLCSMAIPGCVKCTSAAACQVCTAASSLVLGVCNCPVGQFINTTGCYLCTSTIPGCLQCTSSSVCTSCDTASNLQVSTSGNC